MYTPWLGHRLSSAFSSGNLLMRAATASVPKLNDPPALGKLEDVSLQRCHRCVCGRVKHLQRFLAPLRILQASTEVIITLETPDTLNAS
jgi:hypothetical protein